MEDLPMSDSKVYWTDLRTTPSLTILQKLERLLNEAGFNSLNLAKKYTALKIHFGEPGNMAYVPANLCPRHFPHGKGIGWKTLPDRR